MQVVLYYENMGDMNEMIEVENIEKKYARDVIMKHVSFRMDHGVYALIAPNGFGKTTLMTMLATIEKPTRGKIKWNGKDIFELDDKYRNILGYLPQKVGYYDNYSGIENLQYIAALKGLTRKQANKKIEELLVQFHLYDARNKKAKTYSGGMIQRLGIISALLNEPEILLLDEPSAGLDPKERNRLKQILAHLGKDCMILISTHITSDVEFLANRIIMLKNKTVLFQGTVDEISEYVAGKVYETDIKQEEYSDFITSHLILDEQVSEKGIKVRFYSGDPGNSFGWKSVKANLNDIFLYHYGKEQMNEQQSGISGNQKDFF